MNTKPSYEQLEKAYEQLKEHAAGDHPVLTCPYCDLIFHYWPDDPGCHAACICGRHYFGKPPNTGPMAAWAGFECQHHKVIEGGGIDRCIHCGLT